MSANIRRVLFKSGGGSETMKVLCTFSSDIVTSGGNVYDYHELIGSITGTPLLELYVTQVDSYICENPSPIYSLKSESDLVYMYSGDSRHAKVSIDGVHVILNAWIGVSETIRFKCHGIIYDVNT